MATWVLRCKLYPGATPWRNIRFARPFRGGGLILPAMAGLDRWLSRQNPAYRPVLHKKHRHKRCFLLGEKSLWAFPPKVCSLRSIFRQVHTLTENDSYSFCRKCGKLCEAFLTFNYSSVSSVGCTGARPATSDTGRLKAMPLAFFAMPISL